jgi:Flp pilus assembly protein TadG
MLERAVVDKNPPWLDYSGELDFTATFSNRRVGEEDRQYKRGNQDYSLWGGYCLGDDSSLLEGTGAMSKRSPTKQLLKDSQGAAMVEFALVLIVLLMIVLGVIQFGLMWYTKYAIACASREGARYGSIYVPDPSSSTNRMPPANLSPSIETVVRDYITKFSPSLSQDNVDVNLSGSGYTTGNAGEDLVVNVTAQNPWNFLGWLIPSLNNLTFTAETIMKCE